MGERHTPDGDRFERKFEQVFREHYSNVLAYARRRTSADAAPDVVADTFLAAWRRFDEIPNDALPWLLAVARRVLANHARADRRRHALRAKAQVLEGFSEARGDAGGDDELHAALARLPEAEREAILLVAWEGLTPRQAAACLGCSGVAFRARLHRARRSLAKTLSDEDSGTLRHEARPVGSFREETL